MREHCEPSLESYPRIREYFKNKTVFVTGGSGFIGVVLIEKLLRSCPGIKHMYVLLRPKKGLTTKERGDKIFYPELYSKLETETNGAWKKKITIIDGDVTKLNLGISEEDEKILVKEVNIIYHCAASVRFDDALKAAILMNARGTREVCNLALKMKHLEMFCHLSTTYCNINRPVVYEEMLPPVANWREMIEIAENMDENDLRIISPKLIEPFPNTYTFTKNIAEHVVHDVCNGKIPTTIIRPSIVYSTNSDPITGWTNNFNGPIGLIVASGKGILRVTWAKKDIRVDMVSVDFLVKFIIIMTYYRRTREDEKTLKKIRVYNASSELKYAVTLQKLAEMSTDVIHEVAISDPIWYPMGWLVESKTLFFIEFIFLQMLPALLIDGVLKISGNKPRLSKIQKKIYVSMTVLHHFTSKEWIFVNNKMVTITSELRKDDVDEFTYNLDLDHLEVLTAAGVGCKKYLLKEDPAHLEQDRRRLNQMKVLHIVSVYLFWGLVFYYAHPLLYVFFNKVEHKLHQIRM